MKKIIRLISIIVLFTILFSSLVSCKDDKNNSDNNGLVGSGYSLIDNSTSSYKVVISNNSTLKERTARDEIVSLIYEATSVMLTKKAENEVSYSKDAKLIILGDTEFSSNANVDKSKMTSQGFTIKTVDSNVFIIGKDDAGVLYGAYEFLNKILDFEIYAHDEVKLKSNVSNIELPILNITDSPDLPLRYPYYGILGGQTANRFRVTPNDSVWMTMDGPYVHNTFSEYLPKKEYQEKNPNWYSEDGTQLCYTAHGDNASLKTMQDTVLDKMKTIINYYFSKGEFRSSLSFTAEDLPTWCDCACCKNILNKYGTNSAALIQFINPVAKELKKWLEENWQGHEVNIVVFAYYKTVDAPVTKNNNGEYVAIDDSVILEDNVAIWYAPITMEFTYSFTDVKNDYFLNVLEKWSSISSKIYLWMYTCQYHDFLAWYDTFSSMQTMYQTAKRVNTIYMLDQGFYSESSYTGFATLKIYLSCKLAWNVDCDMEKLTNDFFENYFKDAAKPMKEYYDSFRTWSQYALRVLGMNGQPNVDTVKKDYYPKQVLTKWLGYINTAYDSIHNLKSSNIDLYNKLYERITLESIAIRYHLISFWSATYDSTTLTQMKQEFKEDAINLGFTRLAEFISLDSVYSQWGV